MNISLTGIIMISLLGGFLIQKIPSVGKLIGRLNSNSHSEPEKVTSEQSRNGKRYLNTQATGAAIGATPQSVEKDSEASKEPSFVDRYGNYLWLITTLAIYVYLILYRDVNTTIDHIFAILNAIILPIILLVLIGLPLSTLPSLFRDKPAMLGFFIIILPGALMALFSGYTWVVVSCFLVYLLMIGAWIKESSGWFGVAFTVGSIFVSLYLSSLS